MLPIIASMKPTTRPPRVVRLSREKTTPTMPSILDLAGFRYKSMPQVARTSPETKLMNASSSREDMELRITLRVVAFIEALPAYLEIAVVLSDETTDALYK